MITLKFILLFLHILLKTYGIIFGLSMLYNSKYENKPITNEKLLIIILLLLI